MKVSLNRLRRKNLTLLEALEGFGPHTGICYSPQAAFFAVWDGQNAQSAHGEHLKPVDDQIYEARFFNGEGELRWLRDSYRATGNAAYLSESDKVPAGWNPLPSFTAEPVLGQYRLRGKPTNDHAPPGWSCLGEAAINTYAIPLPLGEGKLAQVNYREYLGLDPGAAGQDGNVVVLAQIFVELGEV
jgi:CRISPR-associated protein (TIGR03984 family)